MMLSVQDLQRQWVPSAAKFETGPSRRVRLERRYSSGLEPRTHFCLEVSTATAAGRAGAAEPDSRRGAEEDTTVSFVVLRSIPICVLSVSVALFVVLMYFCDSGLAMFYCSRSDVVFVVSKGVRCLAGLQARQLFSSAAACCSRLIKKVVLSVCKPIGRLAVSCGADGGGTGSCEQSAKALDGGGGGEADPSSSAMPLESFAEASSKRSPSALGTSFSCSSSIASPPSSLCSRVLSGLTGECIADW